MPCACGLDIIFSFFVILAHWSHSYAQGELFDRSLSVARIFSLANISYSSDPTYVPTLSGLGNILFQPVRLSVRQTVRVSGVFV